MGNFLGDQVTVIILTTIQLHSASYLRGKTQEFFGFRKRVTESKLKYLQVYYHKKPGVFRGGKKKQYIDTQPVCEEYSVQIINHLFSFYKLYPG